MASRRIRCSWLPVLALLLELVFGAQKAPKPPHLILIVADDLGWNDVSWHNPEVISPHLGKLASEGIILNQSYVQPICSPTRSALMASRYPFTIGRQVGV
ncbi:hypothetical protein HAZT_HAZT002128 [Hyalella azteca]|uniref:Sulfatase N-terminal domain-containing protein n=1 Tax=Hyalella azteca TaxID=294128 RepID=A0A6A0GSQ7_HYAAZ|nr:hypothetical protein HAZT_HAZT002128 [Hyalella azteca]